MTTKDILNDPFASYRQLSSTRNICLPPKYIGNVAQGIRDQLDSEINLFCSDLDSVVINYDNLKLLQAVGSILDDSPFLHFRVQADYTVFKPTIGCILKGVVNKVSKDHVGCLVHSRFNASIHRPRNNLNGWKGSQLSQGEEFPFEVLDIYSNNAVISLKGKLADEKVIQAYLQSIQKGDSGKKDKNSSSSEPCIDSTGDITLDDDPTPSKKRSKKESSKHNEDVVDSSAMDISESDNVPKEKKKKKKSKSDLKDTSVDKDQETSTERKIVMITAILSRKRRHSVVNDESFTITPKKVRFDSSVQAFSPEYEKKKKRLKSDDSELSSGITDSSSCDDSGSGKKKKKKKHKREKQEESDEESFTKIKNKSEETYLNQSSIDTEDSSFFDSYSSTSPVSKKKHKKKKHKESVSSFDESQDSALVCSVEDTDELSELPSKKKKKKKKVKD